MNSKAPSNALDDLTRKNIQVIAELENAANSRRSMTDRVADAISRFVGSMWFVYLHFVWFGLWIGLSSFTFVPERWRIDPFPYTFLTFIVSLEAIFLSTFILISQNHEERQARRRNHFDLQINLLSEQENSQILRMLERIERRLQIHSDLHSEVLQQATRPEVMLAQIKDVIEDDAQARGNA